MLYQIVKGDTLSELAQRHGVSVDDIMAANPKIKNRDLIFEGDTIEVPTNVAAATGGILKKWWRAYVGLFDKILGNK